MSTRPTNSPLVATDATISSGPESGLSTRLSPGAGILAQGLHAGVRLPGRVLSHIFGTLGDWANYLDQKTLPLAALNWPERATAAAAAAADGPLGLGYAPDLGVNGGGLWVLQTVGTDVWTSEDGIAWTQRSASLAGASFTNPWIAYGKINGVSGFLLSQNANPTNYYTSTDGITWSSITTTAVPGNPVSAYSPSLGLWVMAGLTAGAATLRTSPTALTNTWTARTLPVGWQTVSGGAKRIVWNGSLFVILPLSSYNKCLTSPDGITWTEQPLGVTGVWSGLAYSAADGLWMAANQTTGPMVISVDGLTWTNAASVGMNLGNDLAVLGSLWVMPTLLANGGGIVYSTDKGANWNRVTVGNHRVATAGWNRILAADNRFMVAHGVSGALVELALSQRTN